MLNRPAAPGALGPDRGRLAQTDILLVTGSLDGGGAERVLSDMANYWSVKGLHVTFATWAGPEVADFYKLYPGIQRVWLNVPAPKSAMFRQLRMNAARVRKLRKLLKDSGPVSVLSFIHTSNVLTILSGFGLKTRIVVSERSQPALDSSLSRAWRLLRWVAYRWSDTVVAQTSDAAQWIGRNCAKEAIVIPNPLRLLGPPTGKRQSLIVAIGRLSREKGFDLLLRAFAVIAADFSEWKVAILGNGRERENLARLRDELRITHRVEFVGQVKDVESWMSSAGLVVQPSRFEGFPNAVLESMGMGAAVICADCRSGPSDLIQNGINGRLVPIEDVPALAQAMAELMASPAKRESIGREASRVRERYRQDLIMARWEACVFPHVTREHAES